MDSEPAQQATATPPDGGASGSGDGIDATQLPEMPLFSCKEAYVYRVPPATTVGHRAELWDVNNWLATVSLRVVQADDDAFVRLLDGKTGTWSTWELFAECPVPTDKPLLTAIEPVIDSSRYFVLRIVDKDSQRHAFIGIGFRERSEASNFNAALHEFLQYIKRKRTAEAMRSAYEERLQSAASSDSEAASPAAPAADYSIKEGETLKLRINAAKPGAGGFVSGASARKGLLNKTFSLIIGEHGGAVAAISPPPGSSPKIAMSVSPGDGSSPMHSGGLAGRVPLARLSGAGEAGDLQARLQGLNLQRAAGSGGGELTSASASAASSSVAAAHDDEDEFGDFVESAAGGGGGSSAPGEAVADEAAATGAAAPAGGA